VDRRTRILVGGALIAMGVLWLLVSGVLSVLGFDLGRFVLRLWPVIVSGAGLALVLPPILVRGKRGLGALFIPGVPALVTGGILLLASVFDAWGIWAWLWPMEVLSVALGFLAAAFYMRIIWFLIPATIIGINGLVFQFCAVTGLWSWWSVLWVIEPLSVGLPLLLIGLRRSSSSLVMAGLILCGVAGVGFLLMITVLGGWWPFRLLGGALLVLAGLAVLVWGMARQRLLPRSALE
jgi:hypothetical protein